MVPRSRFLMLVTTVLLVVATAFPAYADAGVVRAQKRLNTLGCIAGTADGVLDDQVRAAVVRFQAANAMAQSGRLDDTTRQRLHSAGARSCSVRPVPASSGSGRRIVLSQRQNWLWLVRADGSVVAQGGVIDNPRYLGTGTYYSGSLCGRAGRILRNSDYSGTLWLNRFVRFAPCGIGFHQIPVYKSTGQQIHPDWLVGTDYRASSGCIRLTRAMSLRLWDFTPSRTKVVVVRG